MSIAKKIWHLLLAVMILNNHQLAHPQPGARYIYLLTIINMSHIFYLEKPGVNQRREEVGK